MEYGAETARDHEAAAQSVVAGKALDGDEVSDQVPNNARSRKRHEKDKQARPVLINYSARSLKPANRFTGELRQMRQTPPCRI